MKLGENTTSHHAMQDGQDDVTAARPRRTFAASHLWCIVAGLCLIIAVALLAQGRIDGAFVVATLGIVAWFLNLRAQFRRAIIEADDAGKQDDEPDPRDEN
jgi:hypothetical protein